MVDDSGPPGLDAPIRNHVRETKRATSARPGLVRGEGALAERRALICVFDNAGCFAAFMPRPVFEELRTAANRSCQSGTTRIGPEVLETARHGNPEPQGEDLMGRVSR